MRLQSPSAGRPARYATFAISNVAEDNGDTAIESECGQLFRNLRRHLGASRQDLAHQVGCAVSVIAALERGDAGDLPPWPEAVRIVTALTAPFGVDPRPALRLIGRNWGTVPEPAPFSRPAPRAAERAARPRSKARETANRRWAAAARTLGDIWAGLLTRAAGIRLAGTVWRLGIAVAAALAVGVFAARPAMLEAAVSHAPRPIANVIRETRELVVLQFAPVRDGLRWIEVEDPRTRRSDKLRTAAR